MTVESNGSFDVRKTVEDSNVRRIAVGVGTFAQLFGYGKKEPPGEIPGMPGISMAGMSQYLTLGAIILGGIGLLWYVSQKKEDKGR